MDSSIKLYKKIERLSLNYYQKLFGLNDKSSSFKKIRISDNKLLTNNEFLKAEKICDIFTAIENVAGVDGAPPQGGEYWYQATKGPFKLHIRKDRNEIDHSMLFNTRFRDFPCVAYDNDEMTPTPDFWVRRYIRLSNVMPKKWQVRLPARFGEIGWKVRNAPVNRSTAINQDRVNNMYLRGILPYLEQIQAPRILEIGAGAGEMGYVLCKALPNCTWYDSDLLGSMVHSAIHLAILLPQKKHYIYVGNLELPAGLDETLLIRSPAEAAQVVNSIVNIPSFLLNDFADHLKLNLVFNAYSFGEMPRQAVENYSALMSHFIQDEGVIFEQNADYSSVCEHSVEDILDKEFKLQERSDLLDWPGSMHGATRSWYSNSVMSKIDALVSPLRKKSILNSFDDKGDVPDITYDVKAWAAIHKLFPEAMG